MGTIHRFPTSDLSPAPDADASDDALVEALVKFADEIGFDARAQPDDIHVFDRAITDADCHYVAEHVSAMPALQARIAEISGFVFGELRISALSPVIQLEMPNVRYLSMEDVTMQVLSTNQMHWMAKSAYFAALVIGFRERMQRVEESCGFSSQ